MTEDDIGAKRILYGRRRGKPLRKGQKILVAEELPKLTVDLDGGEIDLSGLFGPGITDYWLEIGFGSGEHLAWQADHHPDTGILGCEPFLNGVATLLGKLQETGSANVRLHNEAAELLMEKLPSASLDRAFLLFPDPWPKSGHNKRRFVSFSNIAALARILKPGAELRIATDHTDYGAWILWHMLRAPDFEWKAETADDWRLRSTDWPPTRYEGKAVDKGLHPVYYRFRRC
ncbi:tRNA (guanosine(46)-N(7))-methyltransferase TrmB [Sneathiella sp.]|uniref:tRNA (guanine(46)-N(7))-methyltransferase TrmB n=1 Tax=Sneathiella sp. TaxID=1964365 RepID=UPI003566DD4A